MFHSIQLQTNPFWEQHNVGFSGQRVTHLCHWQGENNETSRKHSVVEVVAKIENQLTVHKPSPRSPLQFNLFLAVLNFMTISPNADTRTLEEQGASVQMF